MTQENVERISIIHKYIDNKYEYSKKDHFKQLLNMVKRKIKIKKKSGRRNPKIRQKSSENVFASKIRERRKIDVLDERRILADASKVPNCPHGNIKIIINLENILRSMPSFWRFVGQQSMVWLCRFSLSETLQISNFFGSEWKI